MDVAVVGAGIAGCWTAIKLLRLGLNVALIYYEDIDRGGQLGASLLSVGAINVSPLLRDDYSNWLDELCRQQNSPCVADITRRKLPVELDQLLEFDPLKNINLGVALKSGSGRLLTGRLIKEIKRLGGRVLNKAWVTRIVSEGSLCQGLQYESEGTIGAIYSRFMVLASGGYSSLFHGAVKSGTYGSIHGRLLLAGGMLSNMEFIFKHGYGQPDLGVLTPTEELPGVEIYDEDGQHVEWLERELFEGRGTNNHFQAFMTWRKDENKKYFVDFRYRELHIKLKKIASSPLSIESSSAKNDAKPHHIFGDTAQEICQSLIDQCPQNNKIEFSNVLTGLLYGEQKYSYEVFVNVKTLVCDYYPEVRSRIRQISYFSMGGISHHKFNTSFENVFVCGEAMHDYGAFRVGGLPWALYLCAAQVISQQIEYLCRLKHPPIQPFLLERQKSFYDKSLIQEIQSGLQKHQENGLNVEQASIFIDWIKEQRLNLISGNKILDDALAYLTTAESIMRSSLARQESRGCFFREDYREENDLLHSQFTLTTYNQDTHEVNVNLVDRCNIQDTLQENHLYFGGKYMNSIGINNNASHFLVKKHLESNLGDRIAVETLDGQYSYNSLWEMINRYAQYFYQNHIDEGDRIAFLMHDRLEYVAMFLAAQQIGAIAVLLNTYSKENELIYYLGDCTPKLFISEQSLLSTHSVESIHESTGIHVLDYLEIPLDSISPLETITPISENTAGFILYTSGSTGKPKGAIHRQVSMAKSAQNFAGHVLQVKAEDRLFSTSKMFFAYGLGNSVYFPLYYGATAILESGKSTRDQISKVMLGLKPTVYFSVPAAYADVLNNGGATHEYFNDVRLCVSAGEALPVSVAKNWYENTNIEIIDGIGSTEAVHIFCVSNYVSPTGAHYGKAVPGYELEIVNEKYQSVSPNCIGELLVKGPTLAIGYWNKPEQSGTTFVNGGLITGDRYLENAQGEYVFVGRNGDTFKSSGLWVSALEIESVIRELEFVSETSVIVFQGNDSLLKAKAYIVTKHAKTFEERENIEIETRQHLRERLSKYKMPHSIEIIDELPRTSTGKVAKNILREMAQKVIPTVVPVEA
ncbi:benzoate-CoA ligase family protein [Alteromonadaceae bacterium 2753L.S.0a.02]|nr:benzoate-CoA ligase family protein [Alteromonadaceae bacterium 2753L.S.0a.02]